MTSFKEREHGFEAKFALEKEGKFRLEARATRLIGLWAAEKMGLEGATVQDYLRSLINADMLEAGSADVVRKLRADFEAHGMDAGTLNLDRKMEECLAEAKRQMAEA